MARTAGKIAFALFVFMMLIPVSRLETATEHASPFRLTGDGRVDLFNTHTKERLSIVYRDSDGIYDDSSLDAIDHTLRCHSESGEHPISLKLVELIDHLQDHFKADDVRIISGYRSPKYNASLRRRSRRVAHNSLHTQGLAMDIRLPGVSAGKLGRYAGSLHAGGVGVYRGSSFVHVDVGPVRTW